VNEGGFPVGFDGHATRSVSITSSQSLPAQDLTLAPVTTAAISGTMSDGAGAGLAARVVFPDGAWLRFFPPLDAPSYFADSGSSSYTIRTPAVAGATVDLIARRNYAGDAYQEVHLPGLATNATNATFFFGGLPQTETPPPGAAGVGAGTFFRWYTMPDGPVYVISFRPDTGAPAGSPGYDVFVAGNSLIIPDGFPLPRNAPYTWRIRGSSAFTTVEDAAGPQGFLATAPFYRIAQGSPSTFTTAPSHGASHAAPGRLLGQVAVVRGAGSPAGGSSRLTAA
jgi:hypothetical protein